MRVHVDQAVLAPIVQAAARAVPTRTTLPALGSLLLTAEDSSITVQATDLELAITARAPAEVASPGAVLLPARHFLEIVRRLPAGAVTIEVDPTGSTATLVSATSEFIINAQPAANFPGLPPAEDGIAAALPVAALRRAIQATIFAAAEDEARPILTGVHLTLAAGELRALSTDGFRIAYRRVRDENLAPAPELSVIVPRRNLAEILRFLGEEGTARLRATRNLVLVDLGDVQILSRVLDGSFPSVLDLVPKDYRTRIRADRQQLVDACERVSLLADPSQKAYPITLTPADWTLVVTASSASVGRAREAIPARVEGDALTIIFNAPLLLDGLRSCQGPEALLELSGPLTAARLTSPGDDGYLYVVMPMRPPEA